MQQISSKVKRQSNYESDALELSPGTRIWIYATAPTAAIKGYANLVPILIWATFVYLEESRGADWDFER